MWNIESLVLSPQVQKIAQLDYEISVILYLAPEGVMGHKNYNKTGDARGVELPSILEVLNGCAINKTNKVILLHNHPYLDGGCDPTPSKLDLTSTRLFKDQLSQYGIDLVDHIIVCPKGYFSFKMHNLL